VACLAFVACGGSEPTSATDTGADTTEDQPSDELSDMGDAMPNGFAKKDCLDVANAMAGAATGMGANPDADFDRAIDSLHKAADEAPEELRGDFGIFADAMGKYLETLRDGGIDFSDPSTFTSPKAQQAVKEATAILQAPAVQKAQQNIDKKMKELCGG
jgi:hypothetical protein